jgi:hypothetical protein
LTKALTMIVLGCLLVAGAAVASILGRDAVPMAASSIQSASAAPIEHPVANRESKANRLAAAGFALASLEPQTVTPSAAPPLSEPLRQAFASEGPAAEETSSLGAPIAIPAQPTPKPKVALKPPVQKTYALLSDAQIAAIKGRLNLTSSQESYWPAIEDSLRDIARKIHATKQSNPAAGSPPIDPDSAEVQQLKSAAMPLLFQLREDQKREVRALARIIGLEAVASAI